MTILGSAWNAFTSCFTCADYFSPKTLSLSVNDKKKLATCDSDVNILTISDENLNDTDLKTLLTFTSLYSLTLTNPKKCTEEGFLVLSQMSALKTLTINGSTLADCSSGYRLPTEAGIKIIKKISKDSANLHTISVDAQQLTKKSKKSCFGICPPSPSPSS